MGERNRGGGIRKKKPGKQGETEERGKKKEENNCPSTNGGLSGDVTLVLR